MAVTGRGRAPIPSSWLRRRGRQQRWRLLAEGVDESAEHSGLFLDWFFESGTTSHDLTATGISAGAPSVGSPALTQSHVLAATGVATAAPSVGAPAITQSHVLTATGVASGSPSVGAPALTLTQALTATGVSTSAPSVGTPAVAQVQVLAATAIATSAPSVGAPAAGLVSALTATGIASGSPSVGAPGVTAFNLSRQRLTIRVAPRLANISPDVRAGGIRIRDRDAVASLANRMVDLTTKSRVAVIRVGP